MSESPKQYPEMPSAMWDKKPEPPTRTSGGASSTYEMKMERFAESLVEGMSPAEIEAADKRLAEAVERLEAEPPKDVASEPDFEAAERLLGDLTIADYVTRNDSCRDYCAGCGVMITNQFDILGEPCEPPTIHKKTCKNVVIPAIKQAYLALRSENAALKAEVEKHLDADRRLGKYLEIRNSETERIATERDEARAEASHYRETGRDMCATGHYPIRYSPEEEFGPCPLCAARAEAAKLREAVERGVQDGTLDCVVRGKGKECPALGIKRPEQMCAGCRIRITANVRRREEKGGE